MFGSNFLENFGIPNWQDFPLQGTDAQGGLFGFNQPQPDQGQQQQLPGGPVAPSAGNPAGIAKSPGSGLQTVQPDSIQYGTGPSPDTQIATIASPLASGAGSSLGQDAPAAGIGTDFKQSQRFTGTIT